MTLFLFLLAAWGWFCLVWFSGEDSGAPLTAAVFLLPYTAIFLVGLLVIQPLVKTGMWAFEAMQEGIQRFAAWERTW